MFIYRLDFLLIDALFNAPPVRNPTTGYPTGISYLSDNALSIETIFKASSKETVTVDKSQLQCSYINPSLSTGSLVLNDSEPVLHSGISYDGEDSDATTTLTIPRKTELYYKVRNKGVSKHLILNVYFLNKATNTVIRVFEGFLETSKLSNNMFNYELTFSHFLKNYERIGLDTKFSRTCNVPVFSSGCKLKYYDKDASGNNKYYHKFTAIAGSATANKGCLQFNATLNDTNALAFNKSDYEGGYIKLGYSVKNVVVDHDKPGFAIYGGFPLQIIGYSPTNPISADLLIAEHLGDVFSITENGSVYTIVTRIRFTEAVVDLVNANCSLALLKACDGKYTTCKDKFANSANFRGYHKLPDKNVFTDGLVLNDNLNNLING